MHSQQLPLVAPLSQTSGRLVVPDVLRGVAILGMLVAHAKPLLPSLPPGVPLAMGSANDVASPLFALVMGLSAEILTQRTPPAGRGRMLLQQHRARLGADRARRVDELLEQLGRDRVVAPGGAAAHRCSDSAAVDAVGRSASRSA